MVGLAAHVGGYLLKSSVTTEPRGRVGDQVYERGGGMWKGVVGGGGRGSDRGWAMWTGVVVVVFVQLFPETKRRQFKQALDAYEAAQRDQAQAGSDRASGDDQAPTAR